MNRSAPLPTIIPPARSPVNRSALRRGFLLFTLALCFELSPAARPADGDLGNGNTAEGLNALSKVDIRSALGNTAVGFGALLNNTTGSDNTATGFEALYHNTTGAFGLPGDNTADGYQALYSNTSGIQNTAIGFQTLFNNTIGTDNTATGFQALLYNATGGENTANGYQALYFNTTGSLNTASGVSALQTNTTGGENTATGVGALFFNTTGSLNTASGVSALADNSTGSFNTATGVSALSVNTTGSFNTATGFTALDQNTTGNNNTATGNSALLFNTTGNDNTAEGFQALFNSTGSNNIALGANAGINLTTGNNNIDIGAAGAPGESNTIRIGTVGLQKSAYIRGISGATVAGGVTVIVDTKGHLGTVTSSARFKEAIKPMDKASEAILALRPVTFRYKHELDPDGIPQFGLIAEQVEKVNPDLVACDSDRKVNTVRYEAVNAMLLNEFLKEHRKVEQLESKAQKQEAMIAQQQKQIEALTARLKDEARHDHMLVKVEPPVIGQSYGLGSNDIKNLILSARYEGSSLFPISEWPCHVYIARILDDAVFGTLTVTRRQVEIIAWGMIFRTIDEANAHANKYPSCRS
jgi:hypothetical protein